MIVPCVRCSHGATSLLTYDHAGAEAYLDDATGRESKYDGLALCDVHAGRFTAPRGWALIDRRYPHRGTGAPLDAHDGR